MSFTGKRKRQELDLKTRFEVIKYSQANPQESARKLADKFHCRKTQIRSILLKKEEILKALRLIRAVTQNDQEEQEMRKLTTDYWTGLGRREAKTCLSITGPMLQEKAMQIAHGLDMSQDEFKASNGWLDRFKSRNRIKAKFISGEAGDVRKETVDSWKERLPELLQGYAPENIWNMDETGQFFRALPNLCHKRLVIAQEERDQRRD